MNYLTLHNPIRQLERELTDWFGELDSSLSGCGVVGRGFAPAVDLYEEDDAFVARAELPGIEKGSAEEKIEGTYYRRETWAGSFERRIALPDRVDAEKVTAEMKDGVLTIRVPKLPEAKPQKIDIA